MENGLGNDALIARLWARHTNPARINLADFLLRHTSATVSQEASIIGGKAGGLQPETGATNDGVPLSFNRPPAADLEPWLGRMMVAIASDPGRTPQTGLLCNDAGYVRTAVDVDWTMETADGHVAVRDESILCGQQSKVMPLGFVGGIQVAGFMLRPGGMRALWGIDDGSLLDRIKPMELVGITDKELTGLHFPGINPKDWLLAIEGWLRNFIKANGVEPPEGISQRFEDAAFADPNQSIANFANRNGVALRTLQRIVKRDFGLTPKRVMRRARTLDMAAQLCGVADEDEVEIELRFFDQSHLIREFIAFFGVAPQQFIAQRQGLLTLSLEIRQARRLELLNRIDPGAVRPWMRQPIRPVPRSSATHASA